MKETSMCHGVPTRLTYGQWNLSMFVSCMTGRINEGLRGQSSLSYTRLLTGTVRITMLPSSSSLSAQPLRSHFPLRQARGDGKCLSEEWKSTEVHSWLP